MTDTDKVIAIVGPHFAGKTTVWRKLLGLPAPPATLRIADVPSYHAQLTPERVMHQHSKAKRGVYYFQAPSGIVFPVGLWDGGAGVQDTLMHLENMARFGPVLVEGPTRTLPGAIVANPELFDWEPLSIDPPLQVLVEQARIRREQGRGRNAKAGRKDPEDLAREAHRAWRRQFDQMYEAGLEPINLYNLEWPQIVEEIREALR